MIIVPSRPKKTRISKIQPHNVEATVGNVLATPVDTAVTSSSLDRQTVLESNFGGGDAGIESRFNWQFYVGSGEATDGSGTATVVDAGTMNGFGASTVTWTAGSSPNVRWAGRFDLPLLPGFEDGYEEGWLTLDMKFNSPFSSPKGMKLPGVRPFFTPGSSPDPFGCDEGWSIRQMLSGTAEGSTRLESHMYTYVNQDSRERDDWSNGAQVILKDTVARVETYFKINSAFDAQDGILEQRHDDGTSTTHAAPTTLRRRLTGRYMYCGSEANRPLAKVTRYDSHLFFGGADISWAPLENSSITFGYVKFEIPS